MKIGTMVEFDLLNNMGYGPKQKKSNMAAIFKDGRHRDGPVMHMVYTLICWALKWKIHHTIMLYLYNSHSKSLNCKSDLNKWYYKSHF